MNVSENGHITLTLADNANVFVEAWPNGTAIMIRAMITAILYR